MSRCTSQLRFTITLFMSQRFVCAASGCTRQTETFTAYSHCFSVLLNWKVYFLQTHTLPEKPCKAVTGEVLRGTRYLIYPEMVHISTFKVRINALKILVPKWYILVF